MSKIWKEIKYEIIDTPPDTKIFKWSTLSKIYFEKKIKNWIVETQSLRLNKYCTGKSLHWIEKQVRKWLLKIYWSFL